MASNYIEIQPCSTTYTRVLQKYNIQDNGNIQVYIDTATNTYTIQVHTEPTPIEQYRALQALHRKIV